MEKITFFLTSTAAGPLRKVTLSKKVWAFLTLFVSIGMAVVAVLVVDYFSLRRQYIHVTQNQAVAPDRKDSSDHLWDQIKKLDSDINHLKTKLFQISLLEEKLRYITGLDVKGDNDENGVGGPLPEDVDSKSEMKAIPGESLSRLRREMQQLEKVSNDRRHTLEELLELLERQQEIFSRTPMGYPTQGRISSRYGWRKSPFSGRREFHQGVDIAVYQGAPVTAPADGTIKSAGRNGGLGKMLVIDHGHGVVTRYGHLSKILKKPGDRVKRGDVVARVGSTGRSTGPHLHYEVLVGGAPVNPKLFVLN
ncbi:MAG: M23 family metallopeptidase [Deltaproteobacteria bacterium]|nr:M23 family metallopeptidase [Deltaproteobacteria bacterium]